MGELRGMRYKFVANAQMNADKGVKVYGERAVKS